MHVPLLQHPPAQVVVSQPAHCRLAVQPAPEHCWQLIPAVPHWPALSPGWQTPLASQQPVGQLVASHTHAPLTQWSPAPQAAVPPQRHAPSRQLFACTGSQVPHASPAAAQVETEKATQVSPRQQPFRQLDGVHWQRPPVHSSPSPQPPSAPPHTQPPAVHRSVFDVTQLWHTAPPVPQAVCTGAWQAPLKQQPAGQESASQPVHVPPWHSEPPGHPWQRFPPAPHAAPSVPTAHVRPRQHPAQVSAEQPGPASTTPPSAGPASGRPASSPGPASRRAVHTRATHASVARQSVASSQE